MNEIRLNKAIAEAGICSRRKADELIFAGKVQVNGEIVDNPGTKVDLAKDKVFCQGQAINSNVDKKHCYLAMHKPIEVVCTVNDPDKRTTVIDLLPPAWRSRRIYPIGRLDYFSEGLILLTDDGDFAHKLTHPKWHLPKIYEVTIRNDYKNFDLNTCISQMKQGMTLAEGDKIAPIEVKVLEEKMLEHLGQYKIVLEMTLIQGINRQIRRMCRDLDLTILKLKRIAQGSILLGNLPRGKVRELIPSEVQKLKDELENNLN